MMQITDELVKYITAELLKRLNPQSSVELKAEKKLLHLVGPKEALSTITTAKLNECFEIYHHQNWDDALPLNAVVLLTELNLQALVRVAEGDEGCTVAGRCLMTAILNGQTVVALEEGLVWRHYLSTAPKPLLAKYAGYERILQSYGLKITREENLLQVLCGHKTQVTADSSFVAPVPAIANAVSPNAGRGRKAISEAAIKAACPEDKGFGQTFTLNSDEILTPLAKDYAQVMKLNIIKA